MQPGGGHRTTFAHSVNNKKLVRNEHIAFDFEDEDENSLFVPELPQSLRDELKNLRRKKAEADLTAAEKVDDDLAAMGGNRDETMDDEDEDDVMHSPPIKRDTSSVTSARMSDTESTQDTDGPKTPSISETVATRLAAVRARHKSLQEQDALRTELARVRAATEARHRQNQAMLKEIEEAEVSHDHGR